MKLTQNRIAGLACPPGKKDKLYSDSDQRGLYVRVTERAKSGSLDGKNFLAKYTLHGKKPKIPLGSCGAVSLAKARDAVRSIMGDVAKGIDPAFARKRKAAEEAIAFGLAGPAPSRQEAKVCRRGHASAAPCLRALSRSPRRQSWPDSYPQDA